MRKNFAGTPWVETRPIGVEGRMRGSADRRWRSSAANQSKFSSPARGIIWVLPVAVSLWALIFLAGAELFGLLSKVN